ncbi:MAG: CinA family protein [Chromatiaceae bacterium]|nr:CinA family protein [Gammaproteobacteria bacterium]MCP5300878.1 CinA family protein [Chromatiaceae bacterium]MCP5421649.1 CinA family protein [Chromatiaceae bacterium]
MVKRLAAALERRGWMLTCAESCTGGGIAAALTDLAGSSAWFDRGFVTYSNDAKREMLGVAADTLDRHGAVSRETVIEMAQGALSHSRAQISVAVSGVAGPGGGTPDKPVGTVWLAWAGPDGADAVCERFAGDRLAVRAATIDRALVGLLDRTG